MPRTFFSYKENSLPLGVQVDQNLTFDDHIDLVVKKFNRSMAQVSRVRKSLLPKNRIELIQALVLTHLDYCSSVWASTSAKNIKRLQVIQNRAARLALGCDRYTSKDRLLEKLGWLPVKDRVHQKGLNRAIKKGWCLSVVHTVEESQCANFPAMVQRLDTCLVIPSSSTSSTFLSMESTEGYLFLGDWGDDAKIERITLDGKDREVLVSSGLKYPNGIALDIRQRRLYWTDAGLKRIESITIHGKDRKLLVEEEFAPHPFGITVSEDRIFWTDWRLNSVISAEKDTGRNPTVVYESVGNMYNIKLVDKHRQPGEIPLVDGYSSRRGDCIGNDIWSIYRDATSLEDCARLCTSHSDCTSFMFYNNHRCYPKTKSCAETNKTNPRNVFYDRIIEKATGRKWREDYHCGYGYSAEGADPAECDPHSCFPCCSAAGWCGNTPDHCDCPGCTNYQEFYGIAPFTSAKFVPEAIKRWRDDYRCGPDFPAPGADPGECDPHSCFPCCSAAENGSRWRADLRCGPDFPAPGAASGECDPVSFTPCCSLSGFCGSTEKHCKCEGCVDFRTGSGVSTNRTVHPQECLTDSEGTSYRGTIQHTKSGLTCQRWDTSFPHEHEYLEKYPNSGLDENYCRNPDGQPDAERPWCYTIDPDVRWEYCDIQECIDGCDNMSCDWHKGQMCGGHKIGDVYDSNPGPLGPEPSKLPLRHLICNNHGECNCGICRCNPSTFYYGPQCDDCATCPGICGELRECGECLISGIRDCRKFCGGVTIAQTQDINTESSKLCKFKSTSDTEFEFTYGYDTKGGAVIASHQSALQFQNKLLGGPNSHHLFLTGKAICHQNFKTIACSGQKIQKPEVLLQYQEPESCPTRQLRCTSGECISVDLICDRKPDCDDGSDEEGCEHPFERESGRDRRSLPVNRWWKSKQSNYWAFTYNPTYTGSPMLTMLSEKAVKNSIYSVSSGASTFPATIFSYATRHSYDQFANTPPPRGTRA
ncbi:hypothetical protein Bbelb_118200 [Branchiostoma belcheri]|nr:hypothetical protein Bbelb_118200 [Branchiostoma belcheri]